MTNQLCAYAWTANDRVDDIVYLVTGFGVRRSDWDIRNTLQLIHEAMYVLLSQRNTLLFDEHICA